MKNWFHRHKFHVIAYDHGYNTFYPDSDTTVYHHATFSKCDCGVRKFDVGKSLNYNKTDTHGGLMRARHAWIENNMLCLSDKSDVYDDNYVVTKSNGTLFRYRYQPVTEVGKILNLLKENEDFTELRKHQMVEDAFGELETVIKMHENIEPPE